MYVTKLDLLLSLSLRILLIVRSTLRIWVSKNAIHEAHLILSRVVVRWFDRSILAISGKLLLDSCLMHGDTVRFFTLIAKLAPSWQF